MSSKDFKEKLINIKNKVASGYNHLGDIVQYLLHEHFYLITAILITALSLASRYLVALHPTRDVTAYVFKWMQDIKEVGFTNFYKVQSDYSPLFLFIVGLYTFLPEGQLITVNNLTFYKNWMYYVKSTYFLTEIVIAIGIYLVVKTVTKDVKSGWLGYIIYLCLPVQFFNSAIWGNADTLYFACFIFIIYFILKGRDGLAFLITGVSFGIKLQSVFILPFLVYLIVSKRLKFYKLIYLPLGLLLTFLPAYCLGANFIEPFKFFAEQIGGYSKLTLGCANIWHLINIKDGALEEFTKGATIFGLLLIGLFTAIVFARKIKLDDNALILVGVFLIAIVPMFLPHMHERYFYALDVLVVVYCLIFKKHYFLIVLMQLSSGIAYHNYLAGRHFILALGEDSVNIASWINIFVLTFLFYNLLKLKTEGTVKDFALKYKDKLENRINISFENQDVENNENEKKEQP